MKAIKNGADPIPVVGLVVLIILEIAEVRVLPLLSLRMRSLLHQTTQRDL